MRKSLRGKVFFSGKEADTFRTSLKPEDFLSIQSVWFDVPYQKHHAVAIVLIYLEKKEEAEK